MHAFQGPSVHVGRAGRLVHAWCTISVLAIGSPRSSVGKTASQAGLKWSEKVEAWQGKTATMFTQDLRHRGQPVDEAIVVHA